MAKFKSRRTGVVVSRRDDGPPLAPSHEWEPVEDKPKPAPRKPKKSSK